jgi:hypothetical protein
MGGGFGRIAIKLNAFILDSSHRERFFATLLNPA